MLFHVKQFLTFFTKAAGKFNIMQFQHLLIKYCKKMNFRLKRVIAAMRNNFVITRLNRKQCSRGTTTTQTKALVEKFRYNLALKDKCTRIPNFVVKSDELHESQYQCEPRIYIYNIF